MAMRRAGLPPRREGGGSEAGRAGSEAPFVRLAAELGDCMAFKPKRWREVFEKSSHALSQGYGAKAGGQRRHRLRGANVSARDRQPRSRDEGDEAPLRFPPVLLEQYLDQPAMVGELLFEASEPDRESEDNQSVTSRMEPGVEDRDAVEQQRLDACSLDRIVNVEQSPASGEGNKSSPETFAVRLPVLSTLSPSMRRGISRLPSPTREKLQQIQMLEDFADQRRDVKQLYRSLARQHRQEKQESARPQPSHRSRRKAAANLGSLTALATVDKSRHRTMRDTHPRENIAESANNGSGRQYQLQSTRRSSTKPDPPDSEQMKMAAEDCDAGAIEHNPDTSRSSAMSADISSPQAGSIPCPPVEPKKYRALVCQHQLSIENERKVDEQLKHTIAEVRRWLPLDVIYEFGLGKFASPAQQRATELLARVGVRLQHGRLAYAMDQWKWWADRTKEVEQNRSSLRLQCWWRRICAAKELSKRRRIRLEFQRRQITLLQHLSSKQQQASLRITRFFRQCVHVRAFQRREQQLQAAVVIQKFWQKSCESWLALRRHMRKQQQIQATICIQRYARGMLARQRKRLLYKIARVSRRQQAAKETKAKRAQETTCLGAAIAIQQGFRQWSHRRIVALQRRRAAFEKEKRAIVKVQSYYRGKQARRFAQKHRVAVASAVLVLQCWWRCVCARKSMGEKKEALRRFRQRIRDEVRAAKRSAFPNVMAIKQKWSRLATAGQLTASTKDGKPVTAGETWAAAKIHGFWRGISTRRRLKHQKVREAELSRRAKRRLLHTAATCIQKRVRGIQGRARAWHRRENVSARRIQSFWRGVQTRRRLLQTRNAIKTVIRIQARWRSRRNKETQRLRARTVIKIQRLARKFLGKRWLFAMVRRRQYLAEELEMGRRLMETTKTRIKDELLLQSFVFKKLVVSDVKRTHDTADAEDFPVDKRDSQVDRSLYHVELKKRSWKRRGYDGVWQEVFRNASGNSVEIDNSHFARFLKQLPHSFIHKTQFPAQKVDLCFAKMKEPKTKAISILRFNKAILMVLREKFESPVNGADTKQQEKTRKENRASAEGGSLSVSTEAASSAEIDHANFLRFMKRYVLPSTIQDGRYRRMLEDSCTQRLLWAVEVLRRFAAQIESKKKHDHFMVVYKERQAIKFENLRAAKIQSCYRKYKFRSGLKEMLGAMFIEFVDDQGRAVRFTHTVTSKSVSKRPAFLKGVTCGETIPLPFPGEEFRAFCERHEDSTNQGRVPAEVYCIECEDAMCQICFARDHSKRHALQQHRVHSIQVCSHCGTETATRECLQCGNGKVPFCDCCFPFVHDQLLKRQLNPKSTSVETVDAKAMDAAPRHRYRSLVVMCIECSKRVAQWKCDICVDVFCKRCLISFHAKGMRQYHEFHRLSYFSVLREQAEEKRAVEAEKLREAKRKQLEEETRRREAELIKRNKSATKIQAVARAFLTRKRGKAYMKLVRQTQVARAQRQKDDVVRATVLYKVRSAFGLAPSLKSDTAQEVGTRQQRLAAIKRTLLLEQHLLKNRAGASKAQRKRRWTKKQRAHAEHSAATWCAYDGKVRIRRGEWRNHVATIVSTQNMLLSGRVLVFVELPKRSVVLNWEWIEPYDDDELLRQPYEPPHKVLADLSHDFRAKLSRVVERTTRLAKLLYLQTIEFNDIVQYAWVVEYNKLEQRPEYWNVVLNKRTPNVPKAMQLIERMEEEQREKLDGRVALAKSKLEALLHPFHPRNKPKVAQRRNAVVHVALRGGRDSDVELNEDTRTRTAALRESMHALDSARFWHESVEANPKLSSSRSDAVRFASACSQPPQSSRICWQLARTLQWMDLHADDGFEPTATTLLALSTELQLFVSGELARSLDANGEDFKEALPAFRQLLKLKEETLHLLLSKHEEAEDAEREAAAAKEA